MILQPLHILAHLPITTSHPPSPLNLPHHLPMPPLPLPSKYIKRPLRRAHTNIRFVGKDRHRITQVRALGVLRAGGMEFFFEGVDVVDDGDMPTGVFLEGGYGGEVGGCEV